jgi:hypothetical protein
MNSNDSKRPPPPIPESHRSFGKNDYQIEDDIPVVTATTTSTTTNKTNPQIAPNAVNVNRVVQEEIRRHTEKRAEIPLPNEEPEIGDLDELEKPAKMKIKDKIKKQFAALQAKAKEKHAAERALIAGVAVALIWLTTLSIAQSLVNYFIRGPNPDDVIASGKVMLERVQTEKEAYGQCAVRLLEDCNATIIQAFVRENRITASAQKSNREQIELNYQLRDSCVVHLQDAVLTLNYLNLHYNVTQPLVTFNTSISQTDPRCPLVDSLAKGGAGSLEALAASDRYQKYSTSTVDQLCDQIDARAAYDASYRQNKTHEIEVKANETLTQIINATDPYFQQINKTIDSYLACQNEDLEENGQICPHASTILKAKQMRDKAQAEYAKVKQQVQDFRDACVQVENEIMAFYRKLRDNDLLRFAIDGVFGIQGLPTLAQLGFGLNLDVSIPNFDLQNLIMQQLQPIIDEYRQRTEEYLSAVYTQQKDLNEKRVALLAKSLEFPHMVHVPPYNPPPIDTKAERERWENDTRPFLKAMGNALTKAGQKGVAAGAKFVAILQNESIPANITNTLLGKLPKRLFSFFYYDSITIRELQDEWSRLVSTAMGFDYAYRALRTFKIVRKYWRLGNIYLPPADVRIDAAQKSGLHVDQRNTLQRVGTIIAHPAFAGIVMLSLGGVIVSIFLAMYTPLYVEYVHNCVFGNWYSNGTMITRNLNQIMFNYAASEGDLDTTSGVDRINVKRELDCDDALVASQKQQKDDDDEQAFIVRKYSDLAYQAFTMHDCLNGTKISTVSPYNTATSAATGGNASQWYEVAPGINCNKTMPPIKDATFNCSRIVCANDICPGPNEGTIRRATYDSGCLSEWYIHAWFLGSSMVVITYVLMQASRITFLKGLVRVMWRYLSDGKFTYLATCSRAGDVKFPNIVMNEGVPMEDAIRENIKIKLKKWQRNGWIILFIGIGLNLPWIIVLAVADQTLEMRRTPTLEDDLGDDNRRRMLMSVLGRGI